MHAVLMLFVSLVQGVAATFGMRRSRKLRDWHTQPLPSALPRTKPDIQLREHHTPLEACPLARVPGAGRDPASAHRALITRTSFSPLISAKAGIMGGPCGVFRFAASSPHIRANRSRIPALILSVSKDAGMSGHGCKTPA
jgi:hypothetical protein